jgi:hypothetical protein
MPWRLAEAVIQPVVSRYQLSRLIARKEITNSYSL